MCKLCDEGKPQEHFDSPRGSRRDFLKASGATAVAAAGMACSSRARPRRRRQARPHDTGRPAAATSSAAGRDVDGPGGRRFRPGRRAGRGQEDRRHRAEPARRQRRRDRRARPHRHAGLHRYAPSPVRDGAAQLPRQRHPDQRRLGLAERGPTYYEYILLKFAPGVPAAGRLHQRAVRRPGAARRRRHHGARRLADPSLAAAFGRRHQGAVRYRAPRRVRLFRERRRAFDRATSIRTTRPASSSSGSPRATSSST